LNNISKTTLATTFLNCIVGSIKKNEKNGNVSVFLRVSTHRRVTKDNNKTEITDWHNIVAYSGLAKIIDQYVSVGQKLTIEGEMQVWDMEDQNGEMVQKNYIKANSVDFKSEASISLVGFVTGSYRENSDLPLFLKLKTTRKVVKDDDKIDKSDLHKIVIYGKLADTIEQYLKKGSKLIVIGNLETEKIKKDNTEVEQTYVRARRVKFI
jgi:single-stranded DNA-binding protein